MGVSNVFYLHNLLLPSGHAIDNVTDCTPQAGQEMITSHFGSFPEPTFLAVGAIKPDLVFSTPTINRILTDCGTFGLDTSAGNVDMIYRAGFNRGARDAVGNSTHMKLRATSGFLYWTGIRAAQDGIASINCRFKPIFDGSNAPLQFLGSQTTAMPTSTTGHYTLGPVEVNAAALVGVQEWDLQLNCQMDEVGGDGDVYDSYVGMSSIAPVLTVRGVDVNWWSTYGNFLALSGLTFYLRAKTNTGANVIDATTSHIKFVANNGMATCRQTSGGAKGKVMTEMVIPLMAASNSANTLTITVGSAIT